MELNTQKDTRDDRYEGSLEREGFVCVAGSLGRLPGGVARWGRGLSREDSRDSDRKGRASGEHQPWVPASTA